MAGPGHLGPAKKFQIMLISFSTKLPFKPRTETGFIVKIRQGIKKHTFRTGYRWTAGKIANVYTGARTKAATHHMDKTVLAVMDSIIFFDETDALESPEFPLFHRGVEGVANIGFGEFNRPKPGTEFLPDFRKPVIYVNGFDVTNEIETLAINDGFFNVYGFKNWFWRSLDHGKSIFFGQLIFFEKCPALQLDLFSPYVATSHKSKIDGVVNRAKTLYKSKSGRLHLK